MSVSPRELLKEEEVDPRKFLGDSGTETFFEGTESVGHTRRRTEGYITDGKTEFSVTVTEIGQENYLVKVRDEEGNRYDDRIEIDSIPENREELNDALNRSDLTRRY